MSVSHNSAHGGLPDEVILAMNQILQTPYDDDFSADIPQALNTLFPNQESLQQLSVVRERLQNDQLQLQAEIDFLVSSLRKDQDPERMQIIQDNISDLLAQMSRIREKAAESEAIVRSITKEIQMLDLAKRNISLSMTALKRLQMLVNALEQLETLLSDRKYGEVAQTLGAVKQIAAFFKPYTAVERIAVAWKGVQEFQGRARAAIEVEFDAFIIKDPSKPIQTSKVTELCSVADVLGDDFRNHLIDKYCGVELKEYRKIFRTNQEAGQLDNISRRYAFFRRIIKEYDEEEGKVFPISWNVGQVLCAKFAEVTADDIASLLAKEGAALAVSTLMETLQHTMEFEAYIAKKYNTSFQEVLAMNTTLGHNPKTISSIFGKHMTVLVNAQDKAISDMLTVYRSPKARTSQDGPDTSNEIESAVLPSSTELFYFYGQTLEQCSKLTNGSALFDLCNVFKKWLKVYADEVLQPQLKRVDPPSKDRRSMDSRSAGNNVKGICLVLNTADYCHNTALELEEKLKEKISTDYKSRITMQSELDLFLGVISTCIVQLLKDLESSVEPFLTTMIRTEWGAAESVSGQMHYILELCQVVDTYSEAVKGAIEQKKYLRNFCDKASTLLITKWTNALVKSRPLKEIGAEQLLLDLQALKSSLLKMPLISSQPDLTAPASYTKAINKSTTRLETILKIVIAPTDPAEAFIGNYMLLINDSSFSNFQKILDLKGTPRQEQNILLDKFLTGTSTRDDLDSVSILSSLDMDPPTGSVVQNATTTNIKSGTATPTDAIGDSNKSTEKREVFSDLRKLVSFAVRREKELGNK